MSISTPLGGGDWFICQRCHGQYRSSMYHDCSGWSMGTPMPFTPNIKLTNVPEVATYPVYVVPYDNKWLIVGPAGDEGEPAVLAACDEPDMAGKLAKFYNEDLKAKEGNND